VPSFVASFVATGPTIATIMICKIFKIFNSRTAQEGRTANLVEIGKTAAEIWRLFDFSRWRPPTSWIFQISKFLTVGRLKRAELRRRAKFGRNRSKRGRDMMIFYFSRWRLSAILDLLCVCLDNLQRAFGGLCRCAKFGWNRCSSFDNMHVFRVHEFA